MRVHTASRKARSWLIKKTLPPAELAAHACLPYLRSGPAQWFFARGRG